MQASFDGRPVRIRAESRHFVLVDPLALDGLSEQIAATGELPLSEQLATLRVLGELGLRIGVQPLDAGPGIYDIDRESFEAVQDAAEAEPVAFDVDSGAVVVIDRTALASVARALTWQRYDDMLQAGGDVVLAEVTREVGGPRFALLSADAGSTFDGDDTFRLRPERLVPQL